MQKNKFSLPIVNIGVPNPDYVKSDLYEFKIVFVDIVKKNDDNGYVEIKAL